MAYGALCSLNPVNGLYTSFYPALAFILFTSSRHLSIGTFAVTSIMVYGTISRLELKFIETPEYLTFRENLFINESLFISNETFSESSEPDEMLMTFRLKVATSLTFWCGTVLVQK